jgi:hypothetical protein
MIDPMTPEIILLLLGANVLRLILLAFGGLGVVRPRERRRRSEVMASRKKCLVTLGRPARGQVTSFLFLRYRLRGFKVGAEVLSVGLHDIRHVKKVWSEYGRGYSIYPKVRARASPPNSRSPCDICQHLPAG